MLFEDLFLHNIRGIWSKQAAIGGLDSWSLETG